MNTMPVVAPKPRATRVPPRPASPIKIADSTIKGLVDVFKLLADESRLKILIALGQDGEMHVSALCDLLQSTQPAVSHHLTWLRMAGLVRDLLERFFEDSGNGHKQLHFEDFSLAYRRRCESVRKGGWNPRSRSRRKVAPGR